MKDARDKPHNRRRRRLIKAAMIAPELILSMLMCALLLVYGPFQTMRNCLISTAMTTSSHQYLATMLFSKRQIQQVMAHTQSVKAQQQDLSALSSGPSPTDGSDGVTLEEIAADKCHGYLLEIKNPLRVKLAVTKYLGVRGETTSQLAKDHNAMAAINGGGFVYDSGLATNASKPTGIIITDGQLTYQAPDHNGDRSALWDGVVALDQSGNLIVGSLSIDELMQLHTRYAVTMPQYEPLVVNGKSTYSPKSSDGSFRPRTVIGQKADKSILMLVTYNQDYFDLGATTLDLAQIMLDHGAVTAVSLDGGNSSTIVLNNKVLNANFTNFGERTVPTAFYVTKDNKGS